MPRCARSLGPLLVSLCLIGCQNQSESAESKEPRDAGAEKVAGKVELAVASAVRAGVTPAGAATSGPPADGVMEPTRADAEVALGAAPKLTVGGEGTGPKHLLRATTGALPRSLTMELTISAGNEQGLPPIQVSLGLEGKPSKSASEPFRVTAKIRDVRVTMPNVPAEFSQQLAGLKGSRVTFQMTREGGGYGFTSELGSGAKPELRDLLDSVSEGLAMLAVPTPTIPMGAGGVWMVASREISTGFGLISYRMIKVLSVTEQSSELEFDARRYAVGRAIDPALLGPGAAPATLREFAGAAKAKLKTTADSLMASQFEGDTGMRGALDDGSPGPQGQRMVQAAMGYRIAVVK